MNKTILLAFVSSLLTLAVLAQDSAYTIKGKFDKVKSGTVYLTTYRESGATKDSAQIDDGKFVFKGFASSPITGILAMKKGTPSNDYLNFYVESGKTEIEGDGDSLKLLKIKGSGVNKDNERLKEMMKAVNEWQDTHSKAYEVAYKSKNKAAMDSLDEVDLEIMKAKRKVVGDFVRKYPDSYRSAMAIEQNFAYYAEAEEVEPLYNALDPKIKATTSGMKIKKMVDVYKTVAVGMVAPEIAQADTSGKIFKLSSLRGNYVLVDFWASWCGPCRRENPNIVKAYATYHPKGLEILGVSYDRETQRAKWIKAIHDDKLSWYQVSDLKGWANETSESYYIKAIPSNVLLDKNGRIVAKNLFGQKLADKLKELMP